MSAFDERMAAFRARFLDRAAEDARRIEQALAADDLPALRSICHGLSGNAGMFGFADAGTAAQAVEEAIDAAAAGDRVRALAGALLDRLATLAQER